jgi:hypothetical protein
MKFYCGSVQNIPEKPFPKAYQEEIDFIQTWPLDHLNRHTPIREAWEEKGTGHRIVKIDGQEYSSRIIKVVGWFLDFDTLDEILVFCNGRPHKKILIEQSNTLVLVKDGGYAIYQTKD